MFKLFIYHEDGTLYWLEHFNEVAEAERWLAEEMTRPYWDNSWTHEIVEEPT